MDILVVRVFYALFASVIQTAEQYQQSEADKRKIK